MPGSDQKWTRRKWISQEIQRNSQEPVARYNLEPGMNVIYIVIENLRSPQDGLQSFEIMDFSRIVLLVIHLQT